MYKVIEANGQRIELTANSATGLVYKQVFKRELSSDLANADVKAIKKAQGKKDELTAKDKEALYGLLEFTIRLGFIMSTMCKDFKDYWAKTTYDDFVEWRVHQESKTLQSPEFVKGVMSLYAEEQGSTSEGKN